MILYLLNKEKNLQRSENFPIVSLLIGKYVANIFYVPDTEFDLAMKELEQESTILNSENIITDNRVIALFSESGKVDCYLRPDSKREKDRIDFAQHKELKARGIITNLRNN